ncbi:hypothetical protein DLAC_06858 [Tieghemostelium lacteum]|uniref:Uncharacterized protein n=1 Tax=Tieghemostelium lacteum TaxID=361077 RepID=A0A151ZDN0_TIELA|nr:hypothetical protein DLAC_06858 [Tieghemostelium lacteum]|eukprot:KYQ92029.1 hypothetical protein DLAC_06858 [Tieghemostelium lacteum]
MNLREFIQDKEFGISLSGLSLSKFASFFSDYQILQFLPVRLNTTDTNRDTINKKYPWKNTDEQSQTNDVISWLQGHIPLQNSLTCINVSNNSYFLKKVTPTGGEFRGNTDIIAKDGKKFQFLVHVELKKGELTMDNFTQIIAQVENEIVNRIKLAPPRHK